jgi:hypothetical protein
MPALRVSGPRPHSSALWPPVACQPLTTDASTLQQPRKLPEGPVRLDKPQGPPHHTHSSFDTSWTSLHTHFTNPDGDARRVDLGDHDALISAALTTTCSVAVDNQSLTIDRRGSMCPPPPPSPS